MFMLRYISYYVEYFFGVVGGGQNQMSNDDM